ncbi:MAG: tetratricopeptide repeat protein [Isosphaeraceae bacterium]
MNPHDESAPAPDPTPLDESPEEATPAEGSAPETADRAPAPRARWRLLLAVVLLAVGIGGGVGYAIYRAETGRLAAMYGSGSRPAGARPVAPARPAERKFSTSPDPAEFRTPIRIVHVGEGAASPPVVALGRPDGGKSFEDVKGTRQGLLDRELFRQALLMAARDELGLATRDELLDDISLGSGEGPPLELAVLFRVGDCHALIRRGLGEKAEVLQAHDLGTNADLSSFNFDATTKAESLARNQFVALLKDHGLEGRPNPVREDAPVPPEVVGRLEQLGFVDHIAALRTLHAAIRADGESPARLAALARAYAQLAVLAEYQWHPAHRIFKARALLYAERLFVRQPDLPEAIRGRAFVRALLGQHAMALSALERARSIEEKAAPDHPPTPPAWLPVIDGYLKYDRAGLTARGGPLPRWALFLNMLDLKYPKQTRLAVQAARDVVALDADCCFAYDTICENGELGDLRAATADAPESFTRIFPVKLRSLTDLPASVREPLAKNRDEIALVDALDKAGRPGEDAGEPSWGVLAHLVREARFVHAERRLAFMTGQPSAPADEYLESVQRSVARHRYLPYLQYLALEPQEGIPALREMADDLDMAELQITELPMIQVLRELQHRISNSVWITAVYHADISYRDNAEHASLTNPTIGRLDHVGRIMLLQSPYSAFAMAVQIEHGWDQASEHVDEWRQKVGDAPALIGALGKKYIELKKFDDAEKLLRRYMELSPDRWAYRSLATCYLARGDRVLWKKILDDFLTKTDPAGLEHAEVQVELARYLMSVNKWDEAKRYADAAVETSADWAIECASQCEEGLHDWERAELWIRRKSERDVRSSWPDWYLFCLRTGHGNLEMARDFAERYLAALAERPDLFHPGPAGFFAWSTGEVKPALDFLDRAYDLQPGVVYGIARILVADELGDRARRDGLIGEFGARFKDYPRVAALCEMIRNAPIVDKKPKLDLDAVEKLLGAMPARTRSDGEFLIGRFLLKHGRPRVAQKYLERCGEAPEQYIWIRAIAADSARRVVKSEAL